MTPEEFKKIRKMYPSHVYDGTIPRLCDEVERLQEENDFLEQIRSAQGERLVKMNRELAAYREIGEAAKKLVEFWESHNCSLSQLGESLCKAVDALRKPSLTITLSAEDAQTFIEIMKRILPEEPR